MVRAVPQLLAAILTSALGAHGLLKEIFALHFDYLQKKRYVVRAYLNLSVLTIVFANQVQLLEYSEIWHSRYMSDSQPSSPPPETASKLTQFY